MKAPQAAKAMGSWTREVPSGSEGSGQSDMWYEGPSCSEGSGQSDV